MASGNKPATNETNLWRIVQSIRELFEGRSHAVGTVTLRANQTTTTVSDENCGAGSYPQLEAMTANAAAARATTYISAVAAKSFTITHANNAQTDRTFSYAIRG
jgi:hypothetical protein